MIDRKQITLLMVMLFLLTPWTITHADQGETKAIVRARGHLLCGVNPGLPGFSNQEADGVWRGIDVDLCRGVAAAVLQDATKVNYIPLSTEERFNALASGAVDLLSRNSTWNLSRDATMGLLFAGVAYYDEQGFIVHKESGIQNVEGLNGARICVLSGTTTRTNLGDYFRSKGMKFTSMVFDNGNDAIAAYDKKRCDAFTSDRSQLYAQRHKLTALDAHLILPETIAKEPLGPMVRQNDDSWLNMVRWTLFAMLNAEEMGIHSANVDQIRDTSRDPSVRRFLGMYGALGEGLGIDNGWAYRVIKQVGNYEEIFERNLGKQSPLKIDRGLNAIWSKGGLQYAPPIR